MLIIRVTIKNLNSAIIKQNQSKRKMIKKHIHKTVIKHHTWRNDKHDELTEIYSSIAIRSIGFGMIGIFIPIYLYDLGFAVQEIFLFYAYFFIFRIPLSFIGGRIVGQLGPKHSIAISTIMSIIFLSLLISLSLVGWPLLLLALVFTSANGLFFIALHTDFSKVKDKKHGGKELGWLTIFQDIGSAAGPIVGGVIASVFYPEFSIVIAIFALLASLIPLFITNEPVKVHQHLKYKGFGLKRHVKNFIAISSLNIQVVSNKLLWPLFLALVVFADQKYAKLGIIVGVSVFIAIFSAHMFGKFIDNKKGLYLLRYGVAMNTLLSLVRGLISTTGGAIAVNILEKPVILSYRMPLVKALYDSTDNYEGHRIVYLVWFEVYVAIAKAIFCIFLFILCFFIDPFEVLKLGFLIAGITGILMLKQNFSTLRP